MLCSRMTTLSTDQIEPRHRNDFWHDFSSPLYSVAPLTEGEVLEEHLQARLLGSLLVGKVKSNGRLYSRDRRRISKTDMDGYQLELLLDGSLIGDCDGVDIHMKPGDIGFFDFSRPYKTRQSRGTKLMLYIARDKLDIATGGHSVHGMVLRAANPVTRILSNIIYGLADVMHDMPAQNAMASDAPIIDIIAANIAHQVSDKRCRHAMRSQRLLQDIQAFIVANLGEPNLGPAMLAEQFKISRAHLYRIFSTQGGIAGIIRERRLGAAYRDLYRDRDISITEASYKYGFSSSNQFLRAFSAYYGMTPSQARKSSASSLIPICGPSRLAMHIADTRVRSAEKHSSLKS